MRNAAATIVGILMAWTAISAQAPDPAKVAAGKKAYATQKCATCHAINSQGSKLASPLDGVAGKLSEADIKTWLTDPVTMEAKLPKKPVMLMSTYLKSHKLTGPDVDNLVAYMLTLR